MYRNFNLTDEERKQILEQHSSYGYRQPISEQATQNQNIAMAKGYGPAPSVEYANQLASAGFLAPNMPNRDQLNDAQKKQLASIGQQPLTNLAASAPAQTQDVFACVLNSNTGFVLTTDKKSVVYQGSDFNWTFFDNNRYYQNNPERKGTWYCDGPNEFGMKGDNGHIYSSKTKEWTKPEATQNLHVNCAASLDEIKAGSLKILKHGCKTDAVKKLQEMLGLPANHQTGFFGNITKSKVIEFQKANKDAEGNPLKQDGIVGDKTYNALVKAKTPESTPAPTPTPTPAPTTTGGQ